MGERERFEALLDVLDELRAANDGAAILVEGPRDEATLRALGCAGTIVRVHQGSRTLVEAFEALAREHRAIILMVDWDRKGARFRRDATRLLQAQGTAVDATYRDRVRELLDLPIKDVESLFAYVTRGLERWTGETLDDHVRARRGHLHRGQGA